MMLANLIAMLLSNFGLVMFVLAIIFIILHRIFNKTLSTWEIIYQWIALFALGVTAIYAFIMHLVFPAIAAGNIGWVASPFQTEVAMANLAIGVIGILSFKASYGFRLATVIAAACWLWGDGLGHIYQLIKFHNVSTGNAGSWFWMDVLVPLILIICMVKLRPSKLNVREISF